MLIHIVRYNERIEDILKTYNISLDELKVNNLHITDFKKIPGGVRLKIPFLSKETVQILENTESFISDYYPSVSKLDEVEEVKETKNIIEEEVFDSLEGYEMEDKVAEVEEINSENNLKVEVEKSTNTPTAKNDFSGIKYVRPVYEIPVPYKKSIYPHFSSKDNKQHN